MSIFFKKKYINFFLFLEMHLIEMKIYIVI